MKAFKPTQHNFRKAKPRDQKEQGRTSPMKYSSAVAEYTEEYILGRKRIFKKLYHKERGESNINPKAV